MVWKSAVRKSALIALVGVFLSLISPARASALTITTPSTQTAVCGSLFSLQIVASGGTGGNQFTIASGTLPAGLSLETNTGVISGTPSTSEAKAVTVRVTDNSSATAITGSFTINTGWIVTTIAGTGISTTSGDGGAATSAGMDPHGLSVTPNGTVYFTDVNANTIRKIDSSGIVSRVLSLSGSATGIVAQDNGDVFYNIYAGAERVMKYTLASNTTTAFSAVGTTFSSPRGLISDAAGNFYLAEAQNHYIRKIAANGAVTTLAGTGVGATNGNGGQATSASVNAPADVAVDSRGNLYFTELTGNVVRKIDTSGVITSMIASGTYAGDGGNFVNARTPGVWGIAVDGADNIYFAEKNGIAIRRIDAVTGVVTRVVGTGSQGTNGSPVNGISSIATFSTLLMAIRFDRQGNLYIIDYSNKLIRKVAGLGAAFTAPSSNVSITASGAIKKGVAQTLTASSSATGKVTFYANGRKIPGCISKVASGSAPITVTCAWRPATSGAITVRAVLIPTDSSLATASTQINLSVARRTNNR